MKISLLISSLPSQSTTARMRIWRSLKSNGAATLRDGVYLLPAIHSEKFQSVVICAELAGDFHLGYARQLTDKSSLLFDLAF